MTNKVQSSRKTGLLQKAFGGVFSGVGELVNTLIGGPKYILLQRPRYRDRISFELVDPNEEMPWEAHWRRLENEVHELVLQRHWVKLALMLQGADTSQSSCPAGHRDRSILMNAVIESLLEGKQGAIECEALDEPRIGNEVPSELMAIYRSQPQNYGLAALAVRVIVAQNWDLRGEDYAEYVPEMSWKWIEQNTSTALALLEEAERSFPDSALLPITRLSLLPFYEDSHNCIINWFETALKADAGDTTSLAIIGNFLLPRWFGDYDRLDYVARKAASISQGQLGNAAYTLVYQSALEMEEIPLYFMDMERFAAGVDDLLRLRGNQPDIVANQLEMIWLMMFWSYPGGMSQEDREIWDEKRDAIANICSDILRRRLTAIHAPSWREGVSGALNMVSMVMQEELTRGDHIILDERGVRAVSRQ